MHETTWSDDSTLTVISLLNHCILEYLALDPKRDPFEHDVLCSRGKHSAYRVVSWNVGMSENEIWRAPSTLIRNCFCKLIGVIMMAFGELLTWYASANSALHAALVSSQGILKLRFLIDAMFSNIIRMVFHCPFGINLIAMLEVILKTLRVFAIAFSMRCPYPRNTMECVNRVVLGKRCKSKWNHSRKHRPYWFLLAMRAAFACDARRW